jgi:hypothetical protein
MNSLQMLVNVIQGNLSLAADTAQCTGRDFLVQRNDASHGSGIGQALEHDMAAFCRMRINPNRCNAAITSAPETRLRLGIGGYIKRGD